MPAETLNCPMCGAAASTDSSRCDHCGARLATVACPSCFGLMFIGEKFCSHCGARAERMEIEETKVENCPRCHVAMEAVLIGKSHVHECSKCEGIWVDAETLRQICENQEEQSAVLGIPGPAAQSETVDLEKNIRYVPCPICGELMNRVAFANCSHVVVDVCREHGTWFDRDELRRIVEFIRGGGLMKSREMEVSRLEDEKRSLQATAAAPVDFGFHNRSAVGDWDWWRLGVLGAGVVLRLLLKR